METEASFCCAVCGEENVTDVDVSNGYNQIYIEDCQVCCRPNKLFIHFDEETLMATIASEFDE